jgi:hypothetical protein
MTVEIRQAGNQWLVEVRGEPIGIASDATEARQLAEYWAAKLDCVATWRVGRPERSPTLPEVLTRILKSALARTQRRGGRRTRSTVDVSPRFSDWSSRVLDGPFSTSCAVDFVSCFGNDAPYEPEELAMFQQAYVDACRKLGIRAAPLYPDNNKNLRKELFEAILCAVRLGDRDPVALSLAAIAAGTRYRHAPKR